MLHVHLLWSVSETSPMASQKPPVNVLHSLTRPMVGLCGWKLAKTAFCFSASDIRHLQTGNLWHLSSVEESRYFFKRRHKDPP